MKKKYRKIVVDGIEYAWMYKDENLTIFKDKKKIICMGMTHCGNFTPKFIAELIKNKNNE